jgi:hypothetical protein
MNILNVLFPIFGSPMMLIKCGSRKNSLPFEHLFLCVLVFMFPGDRFIGDRFIYGFIQIISKKQRTVFV